VPILPPTSPSSHGYPRVPLVSPCPTAEQGRPVLGEQGVLHPRGDFGVNPSTDTLHPQNSMNLPPDKMKLLNQYDNEKKWELICDQERFQVKNPPSAYIQKLKSYLDTGGVSRKVRGLCCTPVPWSPSQAGHRDSANGCPCPTVQEASAGVDAGAPGAGDFPEDQLHRINASSWCHLMSPACSTLAGDLCQRLAPLSAWGAGGERIWVQEFLNEENKGLDVLLEYLAFAQCSVAYDMESTENSPGSDKGKERSLEDLNKSTSSSPTQGSSKTRPLTVR
ncbi:Formin-like protein 1, partial [Lamprotornis superbus]